MKKAPAKFLRGGEVVEAFIWDGEDPYGVMQHVRGFWRTDFRQRASVENDNLLIHTMNMVVGAESADVAELYDWVIQQDGFFFVRKHDEFEREFTPIFPFPPT